MGYSSFDGTTDAMFSIIPIIVIIGFIVVLGSIAVQTVQGIGQWQRNNASPILTVDATVIAKRMDVSYHNHNTQDNIQHTSSSTTYYVTFEVPSSDRLELSVSGREYGLLVEQDLGKLTFQGTRYLGFERSVNA